MSNASYSKTRIENKVNKLLSEYRVNPKYPVPLIEIANKLGYRVFYFRINDENKNISGAVNYDTKVILVNPDDAPRRQSFTIGHEIGHIVLNHDQKRGSRIDYRKNIYQPNEKKEKEANMFAAILLMPESEFRLQWSAMDNDISKISDYFGVSPIAATFRAKNLNLITDIL